VELPEHPEAFAAWAERAARVTDLRNPIAVVRWNLHKRYLTTLGAPRRGDRPDRSGPARLPGRAVRNRLGARMEDVVVKPAVSAASFRTLRVRPADREAGEAHLRALLADRDALVQQYLPSTEDYGERALVWIDGRLTHAVRKSPRFSGEEESVSGPVPITAQEADLAARAVACARRPPLTPASTSLRESTAIRWSWSSS